MVCERFEGPADLHAFEQLVEIQIFKDLHQSEVGHVGPFWLGDERTPKKDTKKRSGLDITLEQLSQSDAVKGPHARTRKAQMAKATSQVSSQAPPEAPSDTASQVSDTDTVLTKISRTGRKIKTPDRYRDQK